MIIDKKILFNILILFFLGFIFCAPIVKSGFYLSHDGEAQIARFGAYIKDVKDGQFPFRWAADLNYRYGSSVLIFYYPMPGIVSIPLNLSGVSLENSFKLIIVFSFILCFISFYLWAYELTGDNLSALFGAVLYGLAPYHFLNLYVRGDVAELMALSLAPFVFFAFEKIFKTSDLKYSLIGAVIYAFLILSHNSVSLIFSPIFFFYSIVRSKNKKNFLLCCVLITLGLLMSAFFYIPAIFEAKYTNANLFIGSMFKNNFPNLQSLVYSKWGFGPDVNKPNGLSPQIGVIQWVIVLFSIIFIFVKNKLSLQISFWVFTFSILVFLTLSLSTRVWNVVPMLSKLEFPWRMVSVLSFTTAALGATFVNVANSKVKVLLIIVLILFSFRFLKIQPIKSKPDSFYFNYSGTTYYHGEASSIWTAGDFSQFPKRKIEIINGTGSIASEKTLSYLHTFNTSSKNTLSILDNTEYFPGWAVKIDGKKTPIEFQDINHRGLIEFAVPPGEHSVEVKFGESALRLLSDFLSILGIILLLLISLTRWKINKIKS